MKGSQTVAEILVDQMFEAGIKNVYGVVGDSANPIVDAIRRHPSEITFIHVRNEEAGAFSAGGDALFRVTRPRCSVPPAPAASTC